MHKIRRTLTGLGSTLALISLLASGCAQGGAPTMANGLNRSNQAVRPGTGAAAKPGTTLGARNTGLSAKGNLTATGDDDEGGAPPVLTTGEEPAGGGLRPLPTVTPVPGISQSRGGGRGADEVDAFLGDMKRFGYHGDRRRLVGTVTAVTQQPYIDGWDPSVNIERNWNWWKGTFSPEVRKDLQHYAADAVQLANYRFNVVYYVWVSKQVPGQNYPNGQPPAINFDREIPIIKGIENDEGWSVLLGPNGKVLDFFQFNTDALGDLNHVIRIPDALY